MPISLPLLPSTMQWSREDVFVDDDAGAAAPQHPDIHLVEGHGGTYVFIVQGSQICRLNPATADAVKSSVRSTDLKETNRLVERLGIATDPAMNDIPAESPPLRSISLAIAQKCNLGCSYCYADQGDFGGEAISMEIGTAIRSIDLLFDAAAPGSQVNIAFLGGEPLTNRAGVRAATSHAVHLAGAKNVHANFSITTNGTLLTEDDAEFFEHHGFAVTISIDGLSQSHDRLRPFKNGKPSYDTVIARARPLLARQRRMQVSARVTVTPQNLDLVETLEGLVVMGFHSVGFSPMLSAPNGLGEMDRESLEQALEQMIECGRRFEANMVRGVRYPFLNMVNAMRELHVGSHHAYPCGAGLGYFGVSADGNLYACHRFVNNPVALLGDLQSGVDRVRQNSWLRDRHVHRQQPCQACWARYLCGGGCHHEVIHRGRAACRYIRGWLHYCIQAYTRLRSECPECFGHLE